MTTQSAPSTRHVPALDGVRGIAIVSVLIYHLTAGWGDPMVRKLGSWGWAGVDLFFVLSGYLITGILLDTVHETGYFRNFYTKRVLRILPAFLAFMAAILIVAPAIRVMSPQEHTLLLEHQVWYWTYLVNFLLAKSGWPATPFYTGHLWSLAVEEQFYLVWPFLIARARRPKAVLALAATIIVITAAARILALQVFFYGRLGIYVLPFFRLDALAWGAAIAAVVRMQSGREFLGRAWPALIVAGATVLGLLVVQLHNADKLLLEMQMFGYAAVAILGAGLIGYAISRPANWLTWRPLRAAGKYSYGFYLWHAPILAVVARETRLSWPVYALVAIAVSAAFTAFSWCFVESPALRMRPLVLAASSNQLGARADSLGVS